MGNATNNDAALRTLSELLSTKREFSYDAQENRIWCFPHIINLCVQNTLRKYTQADFSNVLSTWSSGNHGEAIHRDKYITAVQGDPLNLGREIVTAVHASSQRRAAFHQRIENSNKTEVFMNGDGHPMQLPTQELLLDVKTHWDSTHVMINCLLGLYQVSITCDWFTNSELKYIISGCRLPLSCTPKSTLDWEVLQDIEVTLEVCIPESNRTDTWCSLSQCQVPSAAQQIMCSECSPLLGSAIPTYKTFIFQWRHLNPAPGHLLQTMVQPCTFMTLVVQYGLPDLQISHEDQGPQSVKEFSFYIGATSHAKMDPLAFWRVRVIQ